MVTKTSWLQRIWLELIASVLKVVSCADYLIVVLMIYNYSASRLIIHRNARYIYNVMMMLLFAW